MVKILKKCFLILLSFITIISLSACHGYKSLEEFSIPEEFDTSKEYNITFWAKNDSNNAQKKIYKKAIEDFQGLYPNIKVTLKSYTDYKNIYNDVITNISTQTTPNVCISYPDHVAKYLDGVNIVVPLTELMDNEKYGLGGSEIKYESVKKTEIIASFLKECYFKGDYYTLPFMRSTEACYVNKTYVEKLGYTLPNVLTWDFVWEVCEKAMEEKEDNQILIPFIYKSTDNMMIQLAKQSDTGYSLDTGKVLLFNNQTKELLKTIATHSENGCFSTFKISSYPGNFFNAGQCIFAIDSTAGATWMGSDAPLLDIPKEQIVEFETEVMIIPQFDTDNPQMISQGPSVCIFNKKDPNEVLASWLFCQYLLTSDVQIAYSETEGYVPVTSKAQESNEYIDYLNKQGIDNLDHYEVKIKASKLLLSNLNNTFVTPVFNGSASVRDAAGQLIESVVSSVKKKEDLDDEYYKKLYDNVISLYRLDQLEEENSEESGKQNLGKLPTTSLTLIISLIIVWVVIIIYVSYNKYKSEKLLRKQKNEVD